MLKITDGNDRAWIRDWFFDDNNTFTIQTVSDNYLIHIYENYVEHLK